MELIARQEHSEVYDLGGGKHRLVVGGDIENTLPFNDNSSVFLPQTYRFADAVLVATNTYRIWTGRLGYTINVATGLIQIHPVRGEWGVYYSVAPVAPTALSHRQVNDKLLELFVDTPQVRYSFFVGSRFKVNIRLKDSYVGGDEFEHSFNVGMQGLTRQGRRVLYQGEAVGVLPNPFMTDASGEDDVYPVQESIADGVLTFSVSGINSRTLPCDIDPTFGPINPNKDGYMRDIFPTTGFGQRDEFLIWDNAAPNVQRGLIQFDASAFPGGTPTAATLSLYRNNKASNGNATGTTLYFYRHTVYDWEDDGNTTVDAEFNWDNYKDPNVAWPGGSGALADADLTIASTGVVSAKDAWTTADVLDHVTDAIDNRSSLVNIFIKYLDDTATPNPGIQVRFNSLEFATASLRPKLSIDYTASSAYMEGGLGDTNVYMGESNA
ncbi:MAG: DNRLRE domain-containing protein [Planctomycetota bacterium]|jgi:hypothetical protein